MKRIVSGVTLTLLLIGMLALSFNIQPVNAVENIYIRPDGSVDPPTAPITRDGDVYTFTDNIHDPVVVERNNIVVDGAGYTVQGNGTGTGIHLVAYIDNVTIKNVKIKMFSTGIFLNDGASNNLITENNIEGAGITLLYFANNNTIFRNNVTESDGSGIVIAGYGNAIIENFVANTTGVSGPSDPFSLGYGINIYVSDDNTIIGNKVFNNIHGIRLYHSYNNTLCNNEVVDNGNGISLHEDSGNNGIFHNNLINNTWQVSTYHSSTSNFWDDGYPSGGNYWSDYTGVDLYSGPNQDYPSGSDGMGDSAYVIDANNQDRYPLMNPWVERTVGVKVGDWAKYKYEFSWSSTDPNEQPPQDLVDLITNLEWHGITVLKVFETTITFQTMMHFMNGTETKSLWVVDIDNGSGNGTYLQAFIAANLSKDHRLCTPAPGQFVWCGWQIEETILRPYVGVVRETNHLNVTNWSVFSPYFPYNSIDDFYWDRATGILCELLHQESFEKEGYVTSLSLMMKIVDTNLWKAPQHELAVSLEAPTTLRPDESTVLNATAYNYGLSNETNIEIQLFINGDLVNSTIVPFLESRSFAKLTYVWIPPSEGTYNVTAYVHPVPEETFVENNQMTKFVTVSIPPEVGVKAGDRIKYDYTITGWPAGTPYPEWLTVEFLSVEGTTATIRATMRMSDGTQQSATMPVDVMAGGQAFGLSGLVILANLTIGDFIYMTNYGYVTIVGETIRAYAGENRTTVYTSFSQYEVQLTYYWDKLTGVMVEASATYPQLNMTVTAKATATNMWGLARLGVYIRADGSIDPSDAPIITYDNVTYTLTDNITSSADGIVVERDNIVIDGAGYTLQGTGEYPYYKGVYLNGRSNVTIKKTTITTFCDGIWLYHSSNNTISGNTIANNYYGIWLFSSSNNIIYHNNFVDNTQQVDSSASTNVWDDGYPSGGNYWSDYAGVDVKSGPGQDLPGSDGIGDTSYNIDANNVDHYPLMNPFGSPRPPTYALTITTTVGGTTDPSPGTYSYTANSSVQVTAAPNANYLFDHWELDNVNVGSGNLYTILMDKNHTLKAVFSPIPPPLSTAITPLSASILMGQSVTFTSTVSGGYAPYSYHWYLNGAPVSGATSNTWTFTPTTSGIHYVHLKVTDDKGNTAQSDTARITAATVSVGGYSIPIQVQTKAEPIIPYIALIAILTAVFTKLRPKTKRKH